MLALHRTGRQSDALAVCQRLRTRLADNLGLDSGQEITELHRAILTNSTDHPLDPEPRAIAG